MGVNGIKPIWEKDMKNLAGRGDSEHFQVEEKNVWFWKQVGPTPQNILEHCPDIAMLETAFSVLFINSTQRYLSVEWADRNLRPSKARECGGSRKEESCFPLDFLV